LSSRLHAEKVPQVRIVACPQLFVGAGENYAALFKHNKAGVYEAQPAVLSTEFDFASFVDGREVRRQLLYVIDAVSYEYRTDAFEISKLDRKFEYSSRGRRIQAGGRFVKQD